jgi:hypothetical protein
MRLTILLLAFFILCENAIAQKGFLWHDKPDQKKIELRFDGKLLTAYCYFDSTEKPVLFPIKTISGITVTRGFPVKPRPGERTDHPHHTGLWFTYESVNGLDFWNNSNAIPSERKHLYGSIRHQKILSRKADSKEATLETLSHWVDKNGTVLMEEFTVFRFRMSGNDFFIDRQCTLTSRDQDVDFKDVKDGMLGIRVARELEMPSTQADKFVDAQGNETKTEVMDNTGVTGMYYNREGVKGDDTWGKRSQWMYLAGTKDNEKISIVILDHPKNPGYPTYWHARGYGLFAANPLGQAIFSSGKERLDYKLAKRGSISFQYRIVIHSGSELSSEMVDKWMNAFHKNK